jgi:hypothetical protein
VSNCHCPAVSSLSPSSLLRSAARALRPIQRVHSPNPHPDSAGHRRPTSCFTSAALGSLGSRLTSTSILGDTAAPFFTTSPVPTTKPKPEKSVLDPERFLDMDLKVAELHHYNMSTPYTLSLRCRTAGRRSCPSPRSWSCARLKLIQH